MSRNKHDLLKNYRNGDGKSSAKREYRDENVFLKGMLYIDHVTKSVL